MQLEPNMDIYPGLDLEAEKFWCPFRFPLFLLPKVLDCLEAGFHWQDMTKNSTDFGHSLNNQFTLNIGASFNL
jgi:hypothetical protein